MKHYTSFVTILKLGIGLVILFLSTFIWSLTYNSSVQHSPINIIENSLKNETSPDAEISVENLHFTSKTLEQESYDVVAKQAIKTKEGNYKLKDITAGINLKNNNKLTIIADQGHFIDNTQLLYLDNSIHGIIDKYDIFSGSMIMNLNTNELEATDKVLILNDNLQINSNTLKYNDQKKLFFKGDVKTIINFGSK